MAYRFESMTEELGSDNNERISVYCDYYSINRRDLEENNVVAEYVEAHRYILDELISGYKEMGPLNKKICDEFIGCDCETEYENKDRGVI
ncbi:hypothetical protein [Liquorilactobacillus hordei]|uniref:Uncharacterized protein n=1 Tax=Liquorilactobacillus hordei DSM 19519 TaxID=1423759 RepID=A0A0R1MKM9_9LACO|nr:hypothetical protein [Liquorilactobacillus hordei]KRL05957.1 hypothetical protein FC92_GL001238 [Liquorilactobacillus hordei DSM 19519]QYH51889.1 hypothetical protein G6O70_05175 [Liquorilactobacillus hordei DSM 19519]